MIVLIYNYFFNENILISGNLREGSKKRNESRNGKLKGKNGPEIHAGNCSKICIKIHISLSATQKSMRWNKHKYFSKVSSRGSEFRGEALSSNWGSYGQCFLVCPLRSRKTMALCHYYCLFISWILTISFW